MIVPCDNCGKPTKTKLSRLRKHKHTFCSIKCHNDWQTISETRFCEQCGNPVTRTLWAFNRSKHVFCSQNCCNTWRTGRARPEHGEKVRRALKGRKPSSQCLEAISRANTKRLRDPDVQAKMQAGLRKYNETHPGPWKDAYGSLNPNWRGGTSYKPYPPEFNKRLKEQIRKRDGYKCQSCGMTQEEHLEITHRRLSIHHIDYDKSNCHPSNLITLCFVCNAQANGERERHANLFSAHTERIAQHELDESDNA